MPSLTKLENKLTGVKLNLHLLAKSAWTEFRCHSC